MEYLVVISIQNYWASSSSQNPTQLHDFKHDMILMRLKMFADITTKICMEEHGFRENGSFWHILTWQQIPLPG